jgi:hypothetical protein
MKTILLLHDESGPPKPRLQNVAGSKMTQRRSGGMPGCNCDSLGPPVSGLCRTQCRSATEVIDFSTCQKMR